MKPEILVTHPVPQSVTDYLKEYTSMRVLGEEATSSDVKAALGDVQGVLLRKQFRVDGAFLDAGPRLKVVSCRSVGYDNLDIPALKQRNVIATHTPNVLNNSVAELTIALMINQARRVTEFDRFIRKGEWTSKLPESTFYGTDLQGRTLGLVGMGRIAMDVAKKAHYGFGMNIVYYSRSRKPKAETELGAVKAELADLLKVSDFVVVLAALTPETRGMIGVKEFASMKSDAYFINTGRGALVDEDALIETLRERRIAGAALDVYQKEPLPVGSPLLTLENVTLAPHMASATARTREDMAMLAARNLVAALRGEPVPALIPEFQDMVAGK